MPSRPSANSARTGAALDALGDPNRRRVLEIVANGPTRVQDIADQLPISRPAVSRHLRLLKQAALVEDEVSGSERIYRLRPDGVDALRAYFEQLWTEASARFRLAADNTTPRPAAPDSTEDPE